MRERPSFGVGRAKPQDRMDHWIAGVAPGRSFLDLGGIRERSGNERASWAQRCGATDVAMADLLSLDHELWEHFRNQVRAHGIRDIDFRPEMDVDSAGFAEKLGRYDIVSAPLLLYHAPNPVHTLLNLRRVVGEYLIAGTVTVPDVVENEEGRVAFPAASALFLPALRGRERAVMRRYYLDRFALDLDTHAPAGDGATMPYVTRGAPSPWPYWWFFTKSAFERALELLEMRILDRHTWQDHAHFVFLRRK
jgi:hypothetical protein